MTGKFWIRKRETRNASDFRRGRSLRDRRRESSKRGPRCSRTPRSRPRRCVTRATCRHRRSPTRWGCASSSSYPRRLGASSAPGSTSADSTIRCSRSAPCRSVCSRSTWTGSSRRRGKRRNPNDEEADRASASQLFTTPPAGPVPSGKRGLSKDQNLLDSRPAARIGSRQQIGNNRRIGETNESSA